MVANIVVALFIFVSPFIPALTYMWRQQFSQPATYGGRLSDETENTDQPSDNIPSENRLVIPSIMLDK
ncbi:MAG: hypothetical protein U5K77_02130 [Candidatus Saccharibacteria bacterium]|nr:hypothetical protein [Candidatus Saccharibacteria bacterium]